MNRRMIQSTLAAVVVGLLPLTLVAETAEEIPDLVAEAKNRDMDLGPLIDDIIAFGQDARSWLATRAA